MHAEDHLVRDERREQHRPDAQRPERRCVSGRADAAEIRRPTTTSRVRMHLARQRAGQREAPPARDGERADRRHELAFVRHRLEHRGAVRAALLGAGVAENLEDRRGVGLAGHLSREASQRLAVVEHIALRAQDHVASPRGTSGCRAAIPASESTTRRVTPSARVAFSASSRGSAGKSA